jgi:membrane protein implicated in regulation of membrane protease activity
VFRQGPLDFIVTLMLLAVIGWVVISILPVFFVLVVIAILAFVAVSLLRAFMNWLSSPHKKRQNFDSDGRRIAKIEVLEMTDAEPKPETRIDGTAPRS